jgi:hypothetical protein
MDADQLRKHLSEKDFQRMTAFISAMPAEERARLMQFMAERETRAPKVGDPAPDFTLPLLNERARMVTLSSFRGRKPAALIFGSFT